MQGTIINRPNADDLRVFAAWFEGIERDGIAVDPAERARIMETVFEAIRTGSVELLGDAIEAMEQWS